ncbi:hypothetical protein KJ750_01030 [Patescibacteria group bacterium]|nr:hypothetical protein [Patescibacteria group bacterium]MBU2263231.1 hypothetical protein [Patescibacteria group bacterium]
MFRRKRRKKKEEIYPDEIFLDSQNLPQFDTYQMEGRIEKSISKKSFVALSVAFLVIALVFATKIFSLQVLDGEIYAQRSENNRLNKTFILPNRGIIYDRNGEKLAWNDFDSRVYTNLDGFSHVLGYIGLPSEEDLKSKEGVLMEAMIGKQGIEKVYGDILFGTPGMKIIEVDSQNNVISESIQQWPQDGKDVNISIDSKIQSEFFKIIKSVAQDRGFQAGTGMLMNVNNGEILSLASYPEYNSQIISKGKDIEKINEFINDKNKPFLNRATSGLYAPGSIIKPLIALVALNEGIITPEKQILSTGSISIPNPYFPGKFSVFKDWKAHGWVDMRRAIAVSSDVYFYEIGGGFEGQKGLGINKIEEYTKIFGFDSATGIDLDGEEIGTVPNPELKAKSDPSDPMWRIGDTYNASIGQGYFHITPIEMLVYVSALANKGKIIQPHLVLDDSQNNSRVIREINIPKDYFDVIHDGMRMSVIEGTASALAVPSVAIAAKTGTAEIGGAKKYVNSWVIGFFPYQNPKYAFAVVMERGPYSNLVGAPFVMRHLIDLMSIYTPEYLE